MKQVKLCRSENYWGLEKYINTLAKEYEILQIAPIDIHSVWILFDDKED